MPHTLIETAEHAVASVELPNNGEADGIESIEAAFQELLNRSGLAIAGIAGLMLGADEFAVEPGGSASTFTLTVGGVKGLVLPDDGGASYKGYIYTGSPAIDETKLVGGGSLANSTWYYVYAFPDGAGALDFEITTTAPRASRIHKSGKGFAASSRRYLGCFPTDGSGNPLALRAVRGRYLYNEPDDIVSGGATANISTYSTANLASRVPPHSRHALVRARVTRTASGANILMAYGLRTPGATNPSFAPVLVKVPSLSDFDVRQAEVLLSSSRTLEYATTAADCALDLAVAGFQE